MKKFLLSAGALLLVFGLGLSWAGVRMGGETKATVRLFGHSWDVYAPSAGWGASIDHHPSSTPSASLGLGVAQADSSATADSERVTGSAAIPPIEQADSSATVDSGLVTGSTDIPFSAVNLDVDLGSVTIAAGDDYLVEINSWGAGYKVDHWYSGDTLYIESNDSDVFLPTNCGSEITVYVPAGVWLESLYVDLDLGDLTLAGLQMEYAEIDLDLGSLTGEALAVTTTFQVDADLGEVTLFGDLGEYVEISADLGSVQLGLSKPASDYCWELEADMGSITVDGRVQKLVDCEATGGYGNRVIEVDASLGSITLDFDQDFAGECLSVPQSERPPVEALQETTAAVTEDKGTVWVESAE